MNIFKSQEPKSSDNVNPGNASGSYNNTQNHHETQATDERHQSEEMNQDSREQVGTKRVGHLINTGAFTRQNLPGGMPKKSNLEAQVKDRLEKWEENRRGFLRIKSPILYTTLKERTHQQKGLMPSIYEASEKENALAVYPSGLGPVEIRDENGVLLAYRFRIPHHLLQTLTDSTALLKPTPGHVKGGTNNPPVRGEYQCRIYTVWSDYSRQFKESRDLGRDGEEGRQWLQMNKELFDFCSDQLRFLCPEQYVKMTGAVVKEMKKAKGPTGAPLEPLAGAWHGVAINEGLQEDDSKGHQDWMDEKTVFNCVLPFGSGFGGGDLILWQMKMRIGLGVGDGFFFFGSMVAHQVSTITEGVRNSLDLFTHASNFNLLAKHQAKANKKQHPKKEGQVRREEREDKAKKVPANIKARREIMKVKKVQARERANAQPKG